MTYWGYFGDIMSIIAMAIICFSLGYFIAARSAKEKERAVKEQMRIDYERFGGIKPESEPEPVEYHPPVMYMKKEEDDGSIPVQTICRGYNFQPKKHPKFVIPTDFAEKIQNGERATVMINNKEEAN